MARRVKLLQVVMLVAILAAAVRLAFVIKQRLKPAAGKAAATAPPLNREAYVVPKKLHAYDLQSARALAQQPVWVQEGYRYIYYPFDPKRHAADFVHQAGLLGPLEQLQIQEVRSQATPGHPQQRQVIAIFEKDGHSYAVPVGIDSNGEFQIYADEMFFYEDPRQLYSFWPAEVWNSIKNHQVNDGMNEIQADFAVGYGVPQPTGADPGEKIVKYPNGGHRLAVTYRQGRAVKVEEP
ncbi:MAG: hypothetical protein ACR2IF_14350 [Terriglobales bacterium]